MKRRFCVCVAAVLLPILARAQVIFAGIGVGAIPDGGPNGPGDWGFPLEIKFHVEGITNSISDIAVAIRFRHFFAGDLEVRLIPPASAAVAPVVLFSRIGQPVGVTQGGSSWHFSADPDGNTPGDYLFTDNASDSLWMAAGFNFQDHTGDFDTLTNIPPGAYRLSIPGPWHPSTNASAGQPSAFASSGLVGLSAESANGDWILQFRDGFRDDSGEVSAATLTLITGEQTPPRMLNSAWHDGVFEVSVATSPGKHYALEFKNQLGDPWTPLPAAVAGDGSVKVLADPTATTPHRFYRIRAS